MAGLLSGAGMAMPPAAMPPQQGTAPAAEPMPDDRVSDGDGMEDATPEEQEQYDRFVTNGMQVIYGDDQSGVRPDILNRLKESSDPLENLANTAVWLTTMLETSAEKGGTQLDDAVVMQGGRELFEQLADIAEAANIHDYSEKEMEGGWYRALDLYRETATQDGRIDPDQLKAQFGEIEAAGKDGSLNRLLPGVGAAEAEAPPSEGM